METNLNQQKTVQVFYKIFVLFSKKYFYINGKKNYLETIVCTYDVRTTIYTFLLDFLNTLQKTLT